MRLWFVVALVSALGGRAMAIEEAKFTVVREYEAFELRRYAPTLVAETTVEGGFDSVGNLAFEILAGYIQGNNAKAEEIAMTAPVNQRPGGKGEEGEKIEMTAPVNQTQAESTGETESYVLGFVMPSSYTLATLPKPKDERVRIREIPERWVAARRYGGSWSNERYRENEKILLSAIEQEGLRGIGPPVFARYNPPFIPSFMRRNEVLVEVCRESDLKEEISPPH